MQETVARSLCPSRGIRIAPVPMLAIDRLSIDKRHAAWVLGGNNGGMLIPAVPSQS